MAIPDFQAVMLPLLKFAGDGREHVLSEAVDRLAGEFGLSVDERAELLPSNAQARFPNRVAWALSYLKKAALLVRTERGQFRITERGLQVLAQKPERIDKTFLTQFPEFRQFRATRGTRRRAGKSLVGANAGAQPAQRTWLIATGLNGMCWDEFRTKGIAAIGFEGTDDLAQFDTPNAMAEHVQQTRPERRNPSMEAKACYEFAHAMREGDIVYAKIGTSNVVGRGVVESSYMFDASRPAYRHVRRIRWEAVGKWTVDGKLFTPKTLTDITLRRQRLEQLRRIVPAGSTSDAAPAAARQYWWLNCSPSIWRVSDWPIGARQTYTSHNETGNKRTVYQNFQTAKEGDLIVGYETSPRREVVALCRVTGALATRDGQECIEFVKTQDFAQPVGWETLKEHPGLQECQPLRNHQGSLFRLTESEYLLICSLAQADGMSTATGVQSPPPPPYTVDDAMADLFMPPVVFRQMLDLLRAKKNLIVQGPPGVGKSFVSKRLAYALMGAKDDARIGFVQFHQSYSYEDFIQGFRPGPGGGFRLRNGVFYEFCRRAAGDPNRPYVFLIDEINRGNLSKVLGEMMLLIEHDKRGPHWALPLMYADNAETFHVPENVYLLGMMNTADRSLAMVDYALRRRFAFVSLVPCFDSPRFLEALIARGARRELVEHIVERMTDLNDRIAADASNLGSGFCIGHSYFVPPNGSADAEWFRRVIEFEIAPLVHEYWFDSPAKAEETVKRLLAVPWS